MTHADIAKRNKKIIELGTEGLTLAAIGQRFGIQKNTVHKVLKGAGVVPIKIRQGKQDQAYENKYGYTRKEYESLDKELKSKAFKLLHKARSNTYRTGVPFTLKLKDIVDIYTEVCPVFGIPASSVDRIDPTKGYHRGNVQIMSWRANKLKSNASLDELEQLVNFLRSVHHGLGN